MGRFITTVRTDDVIGADPAAVWEVLQQPDVLADLAPTVASITTDADRWCWHLHGIGALGVSVAPSFTERMVFDHDDLRIDFTHDPPSGKSEAAGADGSYHLRNAVEGAYVAIELTAHVDLPLPQMMGGAVRRVMDRAIVLGGQRFADNLLAHLDITESRGIEVVPNDVPWPRTPDRTS